MQTSDIMQKVMAADYHLKKPNSPGSFHDYVTLPFDMTTDI